MGNPLQRSITEMGSKRSLLKKLRKTFLLLGAFHVTCHCERSEATQNRTAHIPDFGRFTQIIGEPPKFSEAYRAVLGCFAALAMTGRVQSPQEQKFFAELFFKKATSCFLLPSTGPPFARYMPYWAKPEWSGEAWRAIGQIVTESRHDRKFSHHLA
jgi:hypothetical protein